MSDPTTVANAAGGAAAYAVGQSVALTSSGLLLGARPEAFILGLVGAVAVCAWQELFDKTQKTYAAVFLSMLLAGYGSPVAANIIHQQLPYIDPESLFYLMPLLVGALVPVAAPVAFKYLRKTFGGENA